MVRKIRSQAPASSPIPQLDGDDRHFFSAASISFKALVSECFAIIFLLVLLKLHKKHPKIRVLCFPEKSPTPHAMTFHVCIVDFGKREAFSNFGGVNVSKIGKIPILFILFL